MKALKSNLWADQFIISPTTDDSLKNMTLAVLKKNNVYAVTSGDSETVRTWKNSSPFRIINSLDWNFGLAAKNGFTPDSLETLFKSGEFKVFGEITIQYESYSPVIRLLNHIWQWPNAWIFQRVYILDVAHLVPFI